MMFWFGSNTDDKGSMKTETRERTKTIEKTTESIEVEVTYRDGKTERLVYNDFDVEDDFFVFRQITDWYTQPRFPSGHRIRFEMNEVARINMDEIRKMEIVERIEQTYEDEVTVEEEVVTET